MGDFLFNITAWLRTTSLLDFAFWLEETWVSKILVENFWGVPIAQVIHISAIAISFCAAIMFMMRVIGRSGMSLTITQSAKRYVPCMWWALGVIIVSGALMGTAEPVRNLVNAVFWFKMLFVVIMILLSVGFTKSVGRQAKTAGMEWNAGAGVKTNAVLISILWCVIIACGRWIAYVPV